MKILLLFLALFGLASCSLNGVIIGESSSSSKTSSNQDMEHLQE